MQTGFSLSVDQQQLKLMYIVRLIFDILMMMKVQMSLPIGAICI